MATPHICNVDCKLEISPEGNRAHVMYASEPSSAAGRYQWELNRAILNAGRRAWRASGQGQSRECRVWDERRRVTLGERREMFPHGRGIRRFVREMSGTDWAAAHPLNA